MSSSSSDSDASERIKNIRLFMVKSSMDKSDSGGSYAYKRQLGNLMFDSNFEAGNLGYVEQIDKYEYDLMIRPDVANPRHRIWFNFTVDNQRQGQCVIFTFVNLSETIKLFHEGLTPVVRSRQLPNWTRLHEDQVFYYRSPAHSGRYVLSIAFRFSSYENEHQFALFYPYSYSTLVSFVQRWKVEILRSQPSVVELRKPNAVKRFNTPDSGKRRENNPVEGKPRSRSSLGFYRPHTIEIEAQQEDNVHFNVEILAETVSIKNIYHLRIDSGKKAYASTVVILCRITNGNLDGSASLVCQGFMDFLLSNHVMAKAFRNKMRSHLIPMIDPDAISCGNSRTDIFGQLASHSSGEHNNDRNIYAPIRKVMETLEQICQLSKQVVLLDCRVNLNLIGLRIVGTQYEDSLRMEKHLRLPRMMSIYAEGFQMENCEFNKSKDIWLDTNKYSGVDQYRLEISPFASYKRSLEERSYVEYDQGKYLSIGKSLVYSLLSTLDKGGDLIDEVSDEILKFHLDATDIDDLVLTSHNTYFGGI